MLGLRLLAIEATVVLVPAVVAPASEDGRPQRPLRPAAGPPPRRHAAGHALADARRSLSEGAELLAGARRDGR